MKPKCVLFTEIIGTGLFSKKKKKKLARIPVGLTDRRCSVSNWGLAGEVDR